MPDFGCSSPPAPRQHARPPSGAGAQRRVSILLVVVHQEMEDSPEFGTALLAIMFKGKRMLLPADLRPKLSPDYVKSLEPVRRQEVLKLLEELRSFELRRLLIEWSRFASGYEPAAHHRLLIKKLQVVASGAIPRLA